MLFKKWIYYPPPYKRSRLGFTLAELLIALLILGVIATFTIPKILQVQQDQRRKAVFKETLAALQAVAYRETNLTPTPGLHDASGTACMPSLLLTRLNYVRHCLGAACYSPAGTFTGPEQSDYNVASNQWGYHLANGAYISGGSTGCGHSEVGHLVDYNGEAGPNVVGQDALVVRVCYHLQGVNCPQAGGRPGRLVSNSGAASRALFNWIFE